MVLGFIFAGWAKPELTEHRARAQTPIPVDWDPQQTHLMERDPQGPDGTRQYGREGNIERNPVFLKLMTSIPSLIFAPIRQINVRTTAEPIFFIPNTFPMAQKNQLLDDLSRIDLH
jgi:hypothetical protein